MDASSGLHAHGHRLLGLHLLCRRSAARDWTHGECVQCVSIYTCLMCAQVSISNIWRFPYMALRNGGGAGVQFRCPHFPFDHST